MSQVALQRLVSEALQEAEGVLIQRRFIRVPFRQLVAGQLVRILEHSSPWNGGYFSTSSPIRRDGHDTSFESPHH